MTTVGDGTLPASAELAATDPAPRPLGIVFADGAAPERTGPARSPKPYAVSAPVSSRRSSSHGTSSPRRPRRSTPAGRSPGSPSGYAGCWTFSVDGLIGATPEMLVRLEKGLVTSRVLAGTIRRTGDDAHDLALAAALARSSKDLEEHEYAVRSVADALAPHCSSMNVPETPFVLHLPNVMHLATDVAGVVADGATRARPRDALHPSAAVCGTPTDVALGVIRALEGMDRGRYAGPVGWFGADGDGEFGIALRCA